MKSDMSIRVNKEELIKKWQTVLNDMHFEGMDATMESISKNTFRVTATTLISPDFKPIDESELKEKDNEK
jgi:hypothetical protein